MISRRKYMSNLPKIKHHPSKKNRADGIVTNYQSQTKLSQTEQDQNTAGSIWLPGPEVCRKLQGSGPDCARQY